MNKNDYNKATISGMLWKFLERVLAQVVSLIVSVVLARILAPDDYSIVGVVTIFFTFANVFITSGLNTALIQKKNSDIEDFSTVLYTSVAVATILYVLLFFFAPVIASIYRQDLLISIIRIMGVILIINAVKSVVCAYISNTLQFKKFFLATLGGTILSGIVGIFMANMGFGPWALVAQQLTNSFIDTIVLLISTRVHFALKFSFIKLKSLFHYGWKIFIAEVISVLYDEINPLVIGLKFKPEDLSFYTKGRSFPNLINYSISDTFSAVLFPVMSKMQDDKNSLLDYTRKFMQMSSFIVFPVMVGLLAVSDSFVRVVLTEKWMPASIYIKIFCITYMFNIIQNGSLQVIRAVGRSDLILKLEITKKSSYFLVVFAFILFSNRPELLAVATIINTGIATVVNSLPSKNLIGYRFRMIISDVGKNLFASLIMGSIVYVMNYTEMPDLLLMTLQILVGVTSYILINKIIKNDAFGLLVIALRKTISK